MVEERSLVQNLSCAGNGEWEYSICCFAALAGSIVC